VARFAAILFSVVVAASFCLPAGAASLKVAVVNLQKIMQASPQARQVKARLKKEFAPQQRKILDKQKKLQELERKLNNTSAQMTGSDSEDTRMQIDTLQHDIQQLRNDFLDDLNLRRNQELSKLQRVVVDEVNQYADDHHFDLVIGDGVFYASSRVNITDKIIERLNHDFKKSGGTIQPTSDQH
jgi:outer membrane protein